jgi:hypothetical protein
MVGDIEEERHSVGEPESVDDADELKQPEPLKDADADVLMEMASEEDTEADAENV